MALKKEKKKQEPPKILEKKAERVGEFIGKRRLFLGSLFLFFTLIFAVAFVDYSPTQEVFFPDFFQKENTFDPTSNVCGKVGATFCRASISVFGAGAYLTVFYLFWMSFLCFRRKARPFAIPSLLAMLFSVLAFSASCALIQMLRDGNMYGTPYFKSGWGGTVGSYIYGAWLDHTFKELGSAILLLAVYAFCVVVVFAENPTILAGELAESLRKTPSLLGKILKVFLAVLLFFPKLLFAKKKKKASDAEPEFELRPVDEYGAKRIKFNQKTEDEIPESELGGEIDEEFGDEASGPKEVKITKKDENDIKKFLGKASVDLDEDGLIPLNIDKINLDDLDNPFDSSKPSGQRPAKSEDTKDFKVSHLEEEKYKPVNNKKVRGDYVFPSVDLLSVAPAKNVDAEEDYQARMDDIIRTLETFKVGVIPAEAVVGPVITRYEVKPKVGVKINKITTLEHDIALGLGVQKVRVTVTNRGTIGIEVPNKVRNIVTMRDIIESKEWNESKADIPVVMGKDLTGKPVVLNLAKMPHALVAGSTGCGKSVCLNAIIASLLYHSTPDDLRFIMVDPKMVELQVYNSLPHMLVPVVTDPKRVPAALKWLITEMMRRFTIFQKVGVKNIGSFNSKIAKDNAAAEQAEENADDNSEQIEDEETMAEEVPQSSGEVEIPAKKLPYIVCVVDELADLMMVAGKEVEAGIARITQLARAAGIHMLIATQRPSTDIVTGLIKANLPTRIGLKCASYIDSRTILDSKGAETLIGNGDMLFIPPGSSELVRAQGAFISEEEISNIVEALKVNGEPEFEQAIQDQLDSALEDEDGSFDDGDGGGEFSDPMAMKAFAVMKEGQRASISFVQRKLRIGYNRAASIMDELEEKGYIGPDNGPSNPREILK